MLKEQEALGQNFLYSFHRKVQISKGKFQISIHWGEVLCACKFLKFPKNNFILQMWFANEAAIQTELYEHFMGIMHCIDSNYL